MKKVANYTLLFPSGVFLVMVLRNSIFFLELKKQ